MSRNSETKIRCEHQAVRPHIYRLGYLARTFAVVHDTDHMFWQFRPVVRLEMSCFVGRTAKVTLARASLRFGWQGALSGKEELFFSGMQYPHPTFSATPLTHLCLPRLVVGLPNDLNVTVNLSLDFLPPLQSSPRATSDLPDIAL